MIKPARRTPRRFLVGEAVRSLFHGLGRVVRGGLEPIVQFYDGPRHRILGETLKPIPEAAYEAETANREVIERFLDIYMFGRTTWQPPALPQKFDLEEALRRVTLSQELYDGGPSDDGRLIFIADDLNDGAAGSGDAFPANPQSAI